MTAPELMDYLLWAWRGAVALMLFVLMAACYALHTRLTRLEATALSQEAANQRRTAFKAEIDANIAQLSQLMGTVTDQMAHIDREATEYRHKTNNTLQNLMIEVAVMTRVASPEKHRLQLVTRP